MTKTRLYIDLDGVLADFDAHFPAMFGVDHRAMLDDDMWAKINAAPSYFRDMPLCPNANAFFLLVYDLWEGGDLDALSILTACPKSDYAHVAGQKREWVREHLGTDITVLPVMGGTNKPLFMHSAGDILIDDLDRNVAAWTAAGGRAILHKGNFAETLVALCGLIGFPIEVSYSRSVLNWAETAEHWVTDWPIGGLEV